MELLAFIIPAAVIWFVATLVFLRIVGGLRWDELRNSLLNYAYKSFTFDGNAIPGMRPHRGARLVIRVLSPKEDGRMQLLVKALETTEPEEPRGEPRARPARSTATS